MKAAKGNKVYTIEENQQKHYQESGFDILGDDGKIVVYGRGKTVPYSQYKMVLDELNALKALHMEESSTQDIFSHMTVEELKKYAQEHDIAIGNASSQMGIRKKLREALKE